METGLESQEVDRKIWFVLIFNKKQTQSYPTTYSHNMCCQCNEFSVIDKVVISTGFQEL